MNMMNSMQGGGGMGGMPPGFPSGVAGA